MATIYQTADGTAASAERDVEIGYPGNGVGGQAQGEAHGGVSPQLEEQVSNDSKDEIEKHLKIYNAAARGDWEAATELYKDSNLNFNDPITSHGETALHIAAMAGHADFVTELVQVMSDDGLRHGDVDDSTAIFFATASGNRAVAEPMIRRNEELVMSRRKLDNLLPLHAAAVFHQEDMVSYLYELTKDKLTDEDWASVLVALIKADMYDTAVDMVKRRQKLGTIKDRDRKEALLALGKKHHFVANTCPKVLEPEANSRCCNPFACLTCNKSQRKKQHSARELASCISERMALLSDREMSSLIGEEWEPIFSAAENGNDEFLNILIRIRPGIVFKRNKHGLTIFHIAVERRHEKIFQMIYEIGSFKNVLARYRENESDNNMLHLAGKQAPPNKFDVVPGPALQLQRELLWFAEVKKVVGSSLAKRTNKDHMTPAELFMKEHTDLLKKGEKWMATTANSCLIVATLVATVAFAAAFTAPGGNDQNTGYPMFLNKTLFRIFAVSDAISLVFAVSSVLTFLSILTSTYTMEDFVRSLPTRLLIGLFTLFVSISAMMVAFVTVFFVYFRQLQLLTYALPVAVVASVPILLFIGFHYRLFVDLIGCYWLFNPNYGDPVIAAAKTNKKA